MRGFTWAISGRRNEASRVIHDLEERAKLLNRAKIEPLFDSFRKDSRFHDVLKCAHLE